MFENPFIEWLIVSLSAYRVQRLVTTDDWPPSEWFRGLIVARFGPDSSWYKLFTCPWCFGTWVAVAVLSEHYHLGWIPMWVHGTIAAAAVVGLLGSRD